VRRKADSFTILVGILLVLLTAFAAKETARILMDEDRDAALAISKAFRTIRAEALDPKDKRALSHAAIRAMIETLDDPYSVFLEPAEHELTDQAQKGEYGAVGMIVSMRDDKIVVVAPREGSPAQKAGIESGDQVVEVNGKSVAGIDLAKVVAEVRGKEGTDVELGVRRPGVKGVRRFTVRREKYDPPVVISRVFGDVGYLRIASFPENLNRRFNRRLDEIVAKAITALVLDVRLNPGGVVDNAVAVCDRFLREGTILTVRARGGRDVEKHEATNQTSDIDLPLVVLVDGGTASASEIVAGALQDLGRAKIVGSKTFGKGVVNQVIPLPDGSAIALTVARYFTPKGRNIHDRGIVPDIAVSWKHRTPGPPDPAKDPQLRKALEMLRAELGT